MGQRLRWALISLLALSVGCGTGMFLRLKRVPLSEGLEAVLGGGGNSGIFFHRGEGLVIDSKLGDFSRRLRHRAEDELRLAVRRLVLTHSHGDHAGNAGIFADLSAVLVHPRTRERLQKDPLRGTPPNLPFVDVAEEVRLVLGGEEIWVVHPGPAHTDGDLVVYFPSRKLLFAGDLLLATFEPRIDPAAGGDVLRFRSSLQRVLELPFERVIPGHGEPVGRALMERYVEYLGAAEAAVRSELAAGRSEDETVKSVTLPAYADLPGMPLGFSGRETTIRLMYKALQTP